MEQVLYTYHFNWGDALWWLIPCILTVVYTIACVSVWRHKQTSAVKTWLTRIFFTAGALFGLGISALWIGISIVEHNAVTSQLSDGNYFEVVGPVENYSPMPWEGHAKEYFTIDGVAFSYSDFGSVSGYHNAASRGGVVTHEGQYLKIQYVDLEDQRVITYIAEVRP